jgi:hypothetical protein
MSRVSCLSVLAGLAIAASAQAAPIIIDASAANLANGSWSKSGNGGYANGNRTEWNWTNAYGGTADTFASGGTSTWTFSGLSAGDYDVYITLANKVAGYTGDWESSFSDFNIYDGGSLLDTVTVDQENEDGTPQAAPDLIHEGVGWLKLGTFTLSSGNNLVVSVTGPGADGRHVIADAVMVNAVPEPASLALIGLAAPLLLTRRRGSHPRTA